MYLNLNRYSSRGNKAEYKSQKREEKGKLLLKDVDGDLPL